MASILLCCDVSCAAHFAAALARGRSAYHPANQRRIARSPPRGNVTVAGGESGSALM
ncbi:hypothetical protein FA95DRAFT_1557278, partial [Auriscalpium vulgare]